MLYITFASDGGRRLAQLDDIFKGCPCILMGGAPTIEKQRLDILEKEPGVLTAAINNAALHFYPPTLWFSGDNPKCYDPTILADPRVMKFMSMSYCEVETDAGKPRDMPNMYFYVQDRSVPKADFLKRQKYTPFYGNTMLTAIHILVSLGVRRIILGGSDFEMYGDKMYAHRDGLTEPEKAASLRLYSDLAQELIALKPVFEASGVELMDCSLRSKLKGVYHTTTLEGAISICTKRMPCMVDTWNLPHGTRFASPEIRKAIGVLEDSEVCQDDPPK